MRKTPQERFWPKVKKGEGCWEWHGALSSGYGHFWDGNRIVQAHVFSWKEANGEIHDGLFVLHECDNRPCVRPDHLFLGTAGDNIRDAVSKGRNRYKPHSGEANGRAKFTREEAMTIIKRHLAGESQNALARELGVAPSTINCIVLGTHWKGLTEEMAKLVEAN
jgi:hypothetical protein